MAKIEHHLCAGLRDGVQGQILDLECRDTLVHEALVALGAGDGHLLFVMKDMSGVSSSHDRRQPQFPADDGGVRRASAVVGNDSRRALHDGHPVGIGRLGHEHGPIDKAFDIARAVDHADRSRYDRIADTETCRQRPALALNTVRFERAQLLARLDGFGSCLDDKERSGLAILGPLHVHWHAVVAFDDTGPSRELKNLCVLEHECEPLGLRCRDIAGRPLAGGGIDHLSCLLSSLLLDNGHECKVIEQRLEDLVLVGIDEALNDGLA